MSKREEAFASFGVRLRNPQWSWSARSQDGNTVVATFWQDFFERDPDRRVQMYRFPALSAEQRKRHGFPELIENLTWARDHCGGQVRAVISRAKDPNADPREAVSTWPRADIIMQLVDFDPETGAHTCELCPVRNP
jgi:hypothetical protein